LESDESEKPSAGPIPGKRPPGTSKRGKRAGGSEVVCCGLSSSFESSNGRFNDSFGVLKQSSFHERKSEYFECTFFV
jgi:hypothetical protein